MWKVNVWGILVRNLKKIPCQEISQFNALVSKHDSVIKGVPRSRDAVPRSRDALYLDHGHWTNLNLNLAHILNKIWSQNWLKYCLVHMCHCWRPFSLGLRYGCKILEDYDLRMVFFFPDIEVSWNLAILFFSPCFIFPYHPFYCQVSPFPQILHSKWLKRCFARTCHFWHPFSLGISQSIVSFVRLVLIGQPTTNLSQQTSQHNEINWCQRGYPQVS